MLTITTTETLSTGLSEGDVWIHTLTGERKVWDGSNWVDEAPRMPEDTRAFEDSGKYISEEKIEPEPPVVKASGPVKPGKKK